MAGARVREARGGVSIGSSVRDDFCGRSAKASSCAKKSSLTATSGFVGGERCRGTRRSRRSPARDEQEDIRHDGQRDHVRRGARRRDERDDRDRHPRQHGAVEEKQQAVDGERAASSRAPRAGSSQAPAGRRNPGTRPGPARTTWRAAWAARRRCRTASRLRRARWRQALRPACAFDGDRVEQHAAVDERRRQHRERRSRDQHDAERQRAPRDSARKPRKRWRISGDPAALLRPRRGEKAHGEHRPEHHHRERSGDGNDAHQELDHVVDEEQHEPRTRAAASIAAACFSQCDAVARRDGARRRSVGGAASLIRTWRRCGSSPRCGSGSASRRGESRSRRMRSKCAGSCACTSSPGRGRWRS